MLQLFGNAATELAIRLDGDEGLFRAYDDVEFLAPTRGREPTTRYPRPLRNTRPANAPVCSGPAMNTSPFTRV